MNAKRGQTRAIALILVLMMVFFGSAAAIAEDATYVEPITPKAESAAPESAAPEVERPDPAPQATEPPAEQEPEKKPEQTPEKKPEQAPAEAQPEAQTPEITPEGQAPQIEYTISWSKSAFSDQTINYQDELVLGLGATTTVEPGRDISLLINGAKPSAKARARFNEIKISFATSNDRYLTVTSSGELTGVRRGSAQLYVTAEFPGGIKKQLRRNVKIVGEPRIRFTPSALVIDSGAKLNLSQFASAPILIASPNVNAGIHYRVEPVGEATNSKVVLDEVSGILTAQYSEPGDIYLVTAATYSGAETTLTLYLGQRTQHVLIEAPDLETGEDGIPLLAAGMSTPLLARAYDLSGEPAARQGVTWVVIGGVQHATIGEEGLLDVSADAPGGSNIIIAAIADDGSGVSGQILIRVAE